MSSLLFFSCLFSPYPANHRSFRPPLATTLSNKTLELDIYPLQLWAGCAGFGLEHKISLFIQFDLRDKCPQISKIAKFLPL